MRNKEYTVKYRTFDQFMYDVEDDLFSFADLLNYILFMKKRVLR